MYELTITRTFSAAHCLRDYDGPCANLHGHNYHVEITVAGEKLNAGGMLMDFTELKAACDETLAPLDHAFLNDLPQFEHQNVTAENIAREIFKDFSRRINTPGIDVTRVRLWESDGSSVIYSE